MATEEGRAPQRKRTLRLETDLIEPDHSRTALEFAALLETTAKRGFTLRSQGLFDCLKMYPFSFEQALEFLFVVGLSVGLHGIDQIVRDEFEECVLHLAHT